ncbi:HAD family phosphatase [Mucilaginibacter sp. SMC90]|uniref:HAD family hydrolase n=1 Tax=Mucilaginibacter sp. SMC90 TaxID=2929803 RepID=UPI001FB2F5AD|nr:HAD family phosphatase [Mucilaginibacter sp. SMC90]UOE46545.1 HAD family phosphatase [Mucilaginibacter sp. SMC90]
MKQAKALLFDLDGTLIDSEIWHYHCWNNLLGSFGKHLDHDLYMQQYSGVSLEKNATRLVNEFSLDVSIPRFIEMREALMLQTFKNDSIEHMPYASQIIEHYRRLNVPMALITSSSQEEVEVVLCKMGMHNVFDKIVSRTDVKNFKPHPEPYQRGVELLGFTTHQCIAIEDALPGIQSAKAAGLMCIAVQDKLYHEFQQAALADVVCHDLMEAQQFISQHYQFV